MKMTIYLPDDLAAEMKDELGDSNVSAICQQALRDELERVQARAKVAEGGFERVEIYDSEKERDVAFQGRRIANSFETDAEAYLTPKETIVVLDAEGMYTYDSYGEFAAEDGYPEDLRAEVADALGEKYTEELDI